MGIFNTPLSDWWGVLGKEEFKNGSGSVKDRPALFMLQEAIATGATEVVEATSGNSGIALAFYGQRLGIKVTIFMPASYSEERQQLLQNLGVNLILTDGGMEEAVKSAQEYLKQERAKREKQGKGKIVYLNQFSNPANWYAHYFTTVPELITQGIKIKRVVVGVGTGGSLVGIARGLKRLGVEIIAVEPAESGTLYNRIYNEKRDIHSHPIEGIGAGFIPKIVEENLKLIDRVLLVDSDEVMEFWRELIKRGFQGGISSAANLWGALTILVEEKERVSQPISSNLLEKNVKATRNKKSCSDQEVLEPEGATVTLFPDHFTRYLSLL